MDERSQAKTSDESKPWHPWDLHRFNELSCWVTQADGSPAPLSDIETIAKHMRLELEFPHGRYAMGTIGQWLCPLWGVNGRALVKPIESEVVPRIHFLAKGPIPGLTPNLDIVVYARLAWREPSGDVYWIEAKV